MTEKPKYDRRPEVVPSPKWVRVFLGGEAVADSKNPLLLRAQGHLPVYYFPTEDVHMEWLRAAQPGTQVTEQGEGPWPDPPPEAQVYTVQVRDCIAANAAWRLEKTPATHPELAAHVAFAWQAMDAWYEEDEQIRVHPHDPYHRIDVRLSSRHVRVVIKGETVAETDRPVLLFETGLPPRYYIPKMDVRMDLLARSDKTTHCAYKGTAPHYSVQVNGDRVENIAWYYPFPNYQYAPIQNLIAFYQERIDGFDVDGERHPAS
ncbi:MAG: DUF427 domain-containing protein [Ardenticatenaceae bacterium]|nr:DUF427 domain-containing protein [Ardenticatenaceae bacterium]